MSRPPSFTPAQRLAVFEMFGAIVLCQGCGAPIYLRDPETGERCDIDHWLAWIDGGAHALHNWRPLCPVCHGPKSANEHKENCRAKRINAAHLGLNQPSPHKIASRPFPKQSRALQSRPFAKRDKPNGQGQGQGKGESQNESGAGCSEKARD